MLSTVRNVYEYYVNLEVLFLKYYFIVIRYFIAIITFSRESIMELW